ncbi:MAG: hypothetical protein HXS48_25435 [Theionarchaea archaeon]|nr:hypothetical protein [Theionarchaea archaeon]
MKKLTMFVLIVGLLMLQTFAVTEELSENTFSQGHVVFSDDEDFEGSENGDPQPCGGHQGGGGDVPG